MYWVTMTDKFLSGWGRAKGKIDKLVIECETYEEALIVERNARCRSEMIYVNLRTTRPYYPESGYYTSWKTKENASGFFIPDRFLFGA